MILLNSAGSITSRISSSSFRNITCNTHLSKYNVKLLTELPKISGFPLISTFDSIYCKTCVKQTNTCNSICAHSIHTNFFLFLTKTFNHTLHKQEKEKKNIKTYLFRTMDFWPKLKKSHDDLKEITKHVKLLISSCVDVHVTSLISFYE